MSGKYIPLIRGEIYGLQIGIDTELNLWEHSQKINYDEIEGEYLIGIGVGFTKAQQIRERIKLKNENLSFEDKVKYFKFLIQTHANRYNIFEEVSNKFLENIDEWGKEEIPEEICNEVNSLLIENKIQRAIDRIYDFNYAEFRLKSIIEYEKMTILLPQLRDQKKKGEINSEESKRGKVEIENQLRNWVKEKNKN